MDIVSKNKTADTPKYSYKYADIAQIHEYLESKGMSYYQFIDRIDGDDYIMTVKIIDGKESAPLRGSRVVDATLMGVSNPAQQQGSALTYARRYSLLMAFGLATDDDDAQSLSREKETQPTVEREIPRSQEPKASRSQINFIERLSNGNIQPFLNKYSIKSLSDLTKRQASDVITELRG